MVKNRFRKVEIFISVILLLAVCCAAGWFLTADMRLYKHAVSHLESGDYAAASDAFEILSDYKDSPNLLKKSKHAIATQLMQDKDYEEAIEIFKEIADYDNSTELLQKCNYELGIRSRLANDYETAHQYFSAAEDYRDAKTQAQRMIYTMGHNAFINSDYDTANLYFDQLTDTFLETTNPHFETLIDAREYLKQQREMLGTSIVFHLGEELDEYSSETIRNMFPSNYYYLHYFESEKQITIDAIEYYPADRILYAWKNEDRYILTEEETQVLDLALQLVAQAEEETDSDIDKELWLHDWLCNQVTYESPDMDVRRKDYIQLKELTCIGAMLEGNANCQGYTDAFYLLGTMAGFEIGRLCGDTGGGHTWNTIKLDDQWYIVDVTFDDLSDANYNGWKYTHFNTFWDPDCYTIWGDAELTSGLAQEPHPSKNYFTLSESIFTDLNLAAEDLVSQHLDDNQDWTYAMVEGSLHEMKDFSIAIRSSVQKRYRRSVSWVQWLEHYGNNTYLCVYWG